MTNKTLGTINLICILIPALLGALEEISGTILTNTAFIGIAGLFMIVFGIWASLRLIRSSD